MFTRAKIYNGGTYLKNHLRANDYYSKGERVTGEWVGIGAEKLGLSGEVTAEQFEALRSNHHPLSGEQLTPRTKDTRVTSTREAEKDFCKKHHRQGTEAEIEAHRLKMGPLPNRVAFYDFQCSAQKSVSIMGVLAGDDRLRDAHERASRIALKELEKFAGRQTNTATTRGSQLTGNICGAAFTHDASRALDPQLHTHFVLANATQTHSGKWFALHENGMLEAVRYAGKVYQNELAREVKALGYEIRDVREKGEITGFEIKGVSQELCERFAKRREEIESKIDEFEKEHGREPTRAEVNAITRQTRPSELKEISTAEVRKFQFGQLSAEEWNQLQKVHAEARERGKPGMTVSAGREQVALKAAVDHLFERHSVLKQHHILAEALNQHLGSLALAKLTAQVETGKAGLLRLADDPVQPLRSEYATRNGLKSELWSVNFVNKTQDRFPALNPKFEPQAKLSPEQRDAVKNVLSTRDQCCGVRGVAGAGKTTLQVEVHRGLDEAGHRVIAIAPTAEAAKGLRAEGFKEATTVADFLQNGASKFDLHRAVVICDEAGLQSNRQGEELLRLARQQEMRVIFVGDVRQNVSVEAGDFLRVLETHSNLSRWEVTEIQRQQHAEYKEAVGLLSSGAARDGLAALDKLGWVHEGQGNYLKDAAAAYFHLTEDGKNLDRCLAVSPTWEENRHLTHEIRSGLKGRDLLPKEDTACTVYESLNWSAQQRGNWRNYEPGQVVTFNKSFGGWKAGELTSVLRVEKGVIVLKLGDKEKPLPIASAGSFGVGLPRSVAVCPGDKILIRANERPLDLINGQVLTIDKIEPDGSLHTREGIVVPPTFKQWTHGYVVTSHKAQGRTCERVVVAAARLDAKSSYVACSRGRELCSVHTPDKAALMAHLPEGNRLAALDVLASNPRAELTIEQRLPAYREIMAEIRRTHAEVNRRTEQARQIVVRYNAERQRVENAERVAVPRESITPDERPRLNFEPIQSQRTGIGI
ncbi:MAG: relaxase domain-containing protein [Methylacidiphilales bacterium]|nr:relaxase domain-containing protein [Candidatus Methylacidiphilales bacterium]